MMHRLRSVGRPTPFRAALGVALAATALAVRPAAAAGPVSAVSSSRGLVESNTATVSEGELLERLRSLRARCVGAKPAARNTLISDLGQRFLAHRVETDGDLRVQGASGLSPSALAKETGEFRFCGSVIPPMPSWEGVRSAARLLSRRIGLTLEQPLVRLDAVRKVDDVVFLYRLASEEQELKTAISSLAPGTPIRASFVITSIDENEIRGVLIRVEQAGDAPAPGSWSSPQLAAAPPPAPPVSASPSKEKPRWGNLAVRDPRAADTVKEPVRSGPFRIKLHETFDLRVGEVARLGPDSPIEIRLAHVKDKTECDENGNCRRGPADIHLQLVAQTGQKGDVIFESPMRDPIELPLAGFRLRVLRLEPRPELHGPLPESSYHAELVLDLGRPESPPPKKPARYTPREDDLWWWWAMILGELLYQD